jgi:hypothetical protein
MVDRSVLRKVLTTAAIGGATFLISNAFKPPVIWSFSLAIFISGVALVVQFLAQFEDRLKVATSVFGLVEASALARDPMIQLVGLSTKLDSAAPELVHDFARFEIDRFSAFMRELVAGGEITYDGEDRDWLLGLTRNVKSTIVDAGFWTSDLGMRYLEAQWQAIQRGVRIRRVFVFDQPELATNDDIIEICKLQQSYGIAVRILNPSTIPSIRRIALFDFVIFDEVVSYEPIAASPLEDGEKVAIHSTRLESAHEFQ